MPACMRIHHPPPLHGLLKTAATQLNSGKAPEAWALLEPALHAGAADFDILNLAGAAAAACGHTETAERLWRQALSVAPLMARGYYNLATLLTELGRSEEAIALYQQALQLHGQDADCHNNLAAVLIGQGRLDQAAACCLTALQLRPEHVGALVNLGMIRADQRRWTEAERHYRAALSLAPCHVNALSNLGALLVELGHVDEALSCYQQALAADAGHVLAWSNLGALLSRQRQFSAAEACLRRALEFAPNNAKTLSNLGQALAGLGQNEAGEACHRRALELEPQSAEIRDQLAGLLSSGARQDAALALYQEALRLKPQAAAIRSNLGALQANLGQTAAAELSLRQAVACDPAYVRANVNLGYLYLAQGRFAEGWPRHEQRYHPQLPQRDMVPPALGFPQWQGQDLQGKSLLVWPEQGLGDEIQFCRYIPLLKQRGLRQLTLVCKPELHALFQTLHGVDNLLTLAEAETGIAAHDYWTLSLSTPLYCHTSMDTIPAAVPYLQADAARLRHWQPRLPQSGLRVGLVWRGHSNHANDARRSLNSLTLLRPLWQIPGIHFISLQKGAAESEATQPPADQPLLHFGSELRDFADTAAILQQLDLLICVDTSSAHLAGALGLPCWLLLPQYNCDWRWLREREDSPWYPSLHLFRQQRNGDWAPVLARVEQALRQLQAAEQKPKTYPQDS